MTEKDEFGFDEQLEPVEQEPGAAMLEEELFRNLNASTTAKKGSPSRLFLLVVLLLVLAGAGAYLYLGSPPTPEAPPPAPPVRQPIAVPPPPPAKAEETMVKTEQIAPPPPAAETSAGKSVQPEAPASGQAAVSARPAEAPARAGVIPSPPPAVAPAPTKAAAPKKGAYSVQAGAFLLKANLRDAEARVRRLGYEPRVKTLRRTLPMTRLRLGAFFAEEGEAKLRSLKAVAPDAFLIRQGEYVLVYAGSFQNLDRARSAADHLYEQGIRVEEETATAEVSLSLLSFGDFADPDAAGQAAARARAAGLEVVVRKVP